MPRKIMPLSLFVLFCLTYCIGCQKDSTSSTPTEKEEFVSLLRTKYKAMLDGDAETWQPITHPNELSAMKASCKMHGLEFPPPKPKPDEIPDGYENPIKRLFPDMDKVQFQKSGRWARLLYDTSTDVAVVLFYDLDGKWVHVRTVSASKMSCDSEGNESFNPKWHRHTVAFDWPVSEDMIWLSPVELIVRPSNKKPVPGQSPKLVDFVVKNIGDRPLTEKQLRHFFAGLSYRVNTKNRGRSGISPHQTVPKELKPGEEMVVDSGIGIGTSKPGKYDVQWNEQKYISNILTVEIK